ncbi:MAG: endonuclease/exonuclease/phosphatase family protein [Woeseiaceae bacterium]
MIARLLFVILFVTACGSDADRSSPLRLTVMTFNAWGAGSNAGTSASETIAVILAANPDIIGLQEMRGESTPCTAVDCPPAGPSAAAEIAAALGYYWYEQQQQNDALWANAILSKYPVVRSTSNDLGVVVDAAGRRVALFNVHLTDYPYQPYQLLGIPYDDAPFLTSESEAIAAAEAARGSALDLLMSDLAETSDVDTVFITGDFNEPSHRDWTARAAQAGRHPIALRFPTVKRIEEAGFRDLYRTAFPDEVAYPGFTWAATVSPEDKHDHADRIDYILMRAGNATLEAAVVAGEYSNAKGSAVSGWPSDHLAVVATVLIP